MTTEKSPNLSVISNTNLINSVPDIQDEQVYSTNPMYQKLLSFHCLQEKQKKRFSVEDLFKLC